MLEVNIKKRLGSFLMDVNFTAENEIMGLLGASGCGKSMTLKCIAGIETPDSGRIVLNGRVLYDSEKHINLSPQKRRVGLLFQQYALFPNMTVYDNIACGVRSTGKILSKAEKDNIICDIIRKMRLEGLENKLPSTISGGQQQRAALARILVNDPEVLLLDEPFSALDDYLKWNVELEISDTLSQFSGPTIFVSHSRDEVYRLCNNVCVLSHGKSAPKVTVTGLFSAPDSLSSCLLSGCKNFSHFTALDDKTINATDWGIELHTSNPIPKGATMIGVRSHYLQITDAPGENTMLCHVERTVEDVFSGIVMLSTPGGSDSYSRIRIDTTKEAIEDLDDGKEMYVNIDPSDIMMLVE
jgi:molybdate transport system ATP-binding protein